jgi:uncharacterized membrane protein
MAAKTSDGDAGTKSGDGSAADSITSQLGLNRLGEQMQGLVSAMADRGVSVVTDRLDGLSNKMSGSGAGVAAKTVENMAKGDSAPTAGLKAGIENIKDVGLKGVSSIKDKVSDAVGGDKGGKKGKDKKFKFINIVEALDLPVPREVAYQAWTQFEQFPSFMKKVENVEQKEDETVEWKAQIFWSHRSWTAEIVDQVPNERIVWRSKGQKGHVDGGVTFHELTPDLTRMLINLEYYPQGLFERTGNLWRAQGRRVRLELKFFRRYITSEVLLRQDEVEGWAGEIHDGKVTEESSNSKDQGSEGRSESAPAAKSSAKKSASSDSSPSRSRPAAKKSASSDSSPSRSRPAAKKSASSDSSPSRSRPAAKKSASSESSPSRSRSAAKKPSSSSASSSRGTTAKKSTTSSSRSRS